LSGPVAALFARRFTALVAAALTAAPAPAQEFPADFEQLHAFVASGNGRIVARHAPDVPRQPTSLARLAAASVVLETIGRDEALLDYAFGQVSGMPRIQYPAVIGWPER
jgi:D-alanyl-D-alanine carboxypeptidase